MANASTTEAVSSADTSGTAIPLGYGYVWGTGKRAEYYELQNTGSDHLDYTRVGIWLLGAGEWDGCAELWINDGLVWTSEFDDPTQFHFHRGSDAIIGSGLYPSSSGPDQGVDSFFSSFPSAINPLCYNRIAYYAIKRKQPIENQTNTHDTDPTQWTDIAPIGLWRAQRVRIFDDQGNVTGYAFSTNPAWHFVDVLLRRKVMPDYNISLTAGPDPLTPAAQARFDWGSIFESAQYFDQFLSNSRRRFTGNYLFSSVTSLNAVLEQILLCCRSYAQEYAGKIYLVCDQPRPSVFTFSRRHIMPNGITPNDQTLHLQPNSYTGSFRDLLVPAASNIASITCADHSNPIVTTVLPHPFDNGDRVAIGGTNTIYDGEWVVLSVPTDDDAVNDITTLTLTSKGSNYPASVGAGGSMGLLYSRFNARTPEFKHKANQIARGAVGLGLPRQLNKVPQTLDFATSTFDQVSRIARYERDRILGTDVLVNIPPSQYAAQLAATPYVTPAQLTLRSAFLVVDKNGALLPGVQSGDHVTIDDTASFTYAGEYSVLDRTVYPFTAQASQNGDSMALTPESNSGQAEFTLMPYNESVMYDTTDTLSYGWPDVPGSDPGNDGDYTAIDLVDGGSLAFLSGAVASGSIFNLPSTGFSPANMLAWAGPQGYIEEGHPMHVISLCAINANRVATLNYTDGEGNIWNGDVNFAAVTWLGSAAAASTTTVGAMTYLLATLDGGEEICFGQGVMADGQTVSLPAGFTAAQMFAVAFPHDSVANGNEAHGVGAYVDSSLVVHLNYQDGDGNIWHGNASVLVFAWKNNMGTVSTSTVSGANWMTCTLPSGFTLGVGMATLANAANFALPAAAGAADSLQIIAGPHDFQIVDHPAHGVGACYLDGNNDVVMLFEDGEGNVWTGDADVFGLFYEPAGGTAVSTDGITVSVTPVAMSAALSGTVQFTAYVAGNSNTAVVWSVDGVAGGNTTVGTIDSTGLYTAPAASGVHTITAASAANGAALSSQSVTVGTGAGSGGVTTSSVVVTPSAISATPGQTVQFSASVAGDASATFNWSVNGIVGGNTTVGLITTSGQYTAPSILGSYLVTATVSTGGAAGSATVMVGSIGGGSGRLPIENVPG